MDSLLYLGTKLGSHQDTVTTTQRSMHLSPAHKGAAIGLLDRRPTDEAFGDMLETAPPGGAKPSEGR